MGGGEVLTRVMEKHRVTNHFYDQPLFIEVMLQPGLRGSWINIGLQIIFYDQPLLIEVILQPGLVTGP